LGEGEDFCPGEGCEVQDTIFQQYIRSKSVFKGDRDVLRPSYIPDVLPHREEQIKQLASILVTALEGQRPSNVLLFGKTGTGKTATIKFIGKEIERASTELRNVHFVYMNCEVVDTQYGVLQNIGNIFIEDFEARIPFTGWSTERVYNILREKIDEERRVIVIALDEIDKLVSKSGDDVLYHLCRINEDLKNAKVSVIGISNDLKFTEFLDPRVKSSLSEEKMVFLRTTLSSCATSFRSGPSWRSMTASSSLRSYRCARPWPPRSTETRGAPWTCSGSRRRSPRGITWPLSRTRM